MCNHPLPVLTYGFRQADKSPFHLIKCDPDSDVVLELTQHSRVTMSGSKERLNVTGESRLHQKHQQDRFKEESGLSAMALFHTEA